MSIVPALVRKPWAGGPDPSVSLPFNPNRASGQRANAVGIHDSGTLLCGKPDGRTHNDLPYADGFASSSRAIRYCPKIAISSIKVVACLRLRCCRRVLRCSPDFKAGGMFLGLLENFVKSRTRNVKRYFRQKNSMLGPCVSGRNAFC